MDSISGTMRPPRWVRAADGVAAALLLLALGIWMSGGFVLRPGDLRLSFRSEWRVAGWGLGLLVVRHLLFRRLPIHQRLVAGIRYALSRHASRPLDDDVVAVPATSTPKRRRQVALGAAAVIVLFWGLTFAMTYPQVRVLQSGVSPDMGDPLFSTWRLAWVAHQLPRDPAHVFDGNIFYPTKGTLAFSDAMLVPALMAAPLLWLGIHQLVVYNLLLLSGFALSGAAMFLLVRSLTQHTGAALIAGFVFAFLPYRFMHYAHLELQMAQWMPLCLWAFHRTVSSGRWRDGLLTGLFLAAQTLSSFYYGIFFATYLIPVGIALLAGAGRARLWPALRALSAGAVLAVVLVVPVTRPYFAARQSVGERPLSEVAFYSAKPQDYLIAHSRNALFGPHWKGVQAQERELFSGVAVPVLALAALWPPVSTARMGYCVALAVAFELSLGTNGVVYPWMRTHLVPFRGLRVPARMAILVGLSLAILAGYAVARMSRAVSSRSARVAVLVISTIAVVAEYRSTLVLGNVWRTPPPVYDALARRPGAVLLELPLIAPDVALEPIYMYFSTFHWHRMVNGYSGFSPRSYSTLLNLIETFPDDASMDELRRRGADYVVVHGAFYSPPVYLDLVARMDQRPDLRLEEVTQWDQSETRLYRMVTSGSALRDQPSPASDPR